MNRRTVLASIAAGSTLGLAGCLGAPTAVDDGPDRNTTSDPLPSPDCSHKDEFDALAQGFEEDELSWGETATGWDLRVDAETFDRGDVAHVTLRNGSGELLSTSHRLNYNLQVETPTGWRDVRKVPPDVVVPPWPQLLLRHPTGEGFEWALTLSEDELPNDFINGGVGVCYDLPAGRYRFVYWGGPVVGVDFTLDS